MTDKPAGDPWHFTRSHLSDKFLNTTKNRRTCKACAKAKISVLSASHLRSSALRLRGGQQIPLN